MILTVSGPTLLSELNHKSTQYNRFYEAETAQSVCSDLVSGTGWTCTVSAPFATEQISVGFMGKTIMQALLEIVEILHCHLREDFVTRTVYIDDFGEDSGIYLTNVERASLETRDYSYIGLIESLKTREDSEQIINKIIPLGSGEGINAFTMRWSTRSIANGDPYDIQTGTLPDGSTYWYIADAASITALGGGLTGTREAVVPFKDITPLANTPTAFENASNALYDLAVEVMQRRKDPIIVHDVVAAFNKVLPIVPGKFLTCLFAERIEAVDGTFAGHVVDDQLVIIDRSVNYNEDGTTKVALTVAERDAWLLTNEEITIGSLETLAGFRVNLKLYPCFQDHGTMRESIETAGSHWFRYRIRYTEFTHFVHGCWIDFDLEGLKANAKTVSTKTDESSGPSSDESADSSTHTHSISLSPENTSGANQFVVDPHDHGYIGVSSAIAPSGSHTHDIAHTHNVPGHNHTLAYGIFRDSLPSPATTQVYVNGVLHGTYTADQSEIDISDKILDIDGQPLRQENIVEFRTSASKAYDVVAHAYSFVSVSGIGKGVA